MEADCLPIANDLMAKAGDRLHLPVDGLCADRIDPAAHTEVEDADHIQPDMAMVDIGPKTIDAFSAEIKKAGTILWNGPMGIFEMEPFARGTAAIGDAVADSGAITVDGGGDTAA